MLMFYIETFYMEKKYKINVSAWKTLGKIHENTEHNGVVARARTACQIPTFVK